MQSGVDRRINYVRHGCTGQGAIFLRSRYGEASWSNIPLGGCHPWASYTDPGTTIWGTMPLKDSPVIMRRWKKASGCAVGAI
jgi:hypothetical protein